MEISTEIYEYLQKLIKYNLRLKEKSENDKVKNRD